MGKLTTLLRDKVSTLTDQPSLRSGVPSESSITDHLASPHARRFRCGSGSGVPVPAGRDEQLRQAGANGGRDCREKLELEVLLVGYLAVAGSVYLVAEVSIFSIVIVFFAG